MRTHLPTILILAALVWTPAADASPCVTDCYLSEIRDAANAATRHDLPPCVPSGSPDIPHECGLPQNWFSCLLSHVMNFPPPSSDC